MLTGLLEVPTTHSAGQYVIDPHIRSRGPFDDPVSPHPFIASPFHRLWLHVEAVDGTGQTVYESGVYDADTGSCTLTPTSRSTKPRWASRLVRAGEEQRSQKVIRIQ